MNGCCQGFVWFFKSGPGISVIPQSDRDRAQWDLLGPETFSWTTWASVINDTLWNVYCDEQGDPKDFYTMYDIILRRVSEQLMWETNLTTEAPKLYKPPTTNPFHQVTIWPVQESRIAAPTECAWKFLRRPVVLSAISMWSKCVSQLAAFAFRIWSSNSFKFIMCSTTLMMLSTTQIKIAQDEDAALLRQPTLPLNFWEDVSQKGLRICFLPCSCLIFFNLFLFFGCERKYKIENKKERQRERSYTNQPFCKWKQRCVECAGPSVFELFRGRLREEAFLGFWRGRAKPFTGDPARSFEKLLVKLLANQILSSM